MRRMVCTNSQLSSSKLLACLALSVLALPVFCYASDRNNPAPANSAYVYVGWLSGSTDYISGFAVASDGSAQPVSGSPFNLPSWSLVASGSHLFGDDLQNIASYNVLSDGSLQETSVVNGLAYIPDPGGQAVYALNLDRTGQTLNAVDSCGSCNSEVLPWSISAGGELSYIGGATMPLGPAKWQGVITFSPDNRYAYTPIAQDFGTLQRNSNGTLTWIHPGFVYAPPLSNLQLQVCNINTVAASAQGYVTLAWYGGGPGCNAGGYILGNYTVGSDGGLSLVPGSGVTPQVQENALAFDPSGTYLAVAGNGIQILKLRPHGTMTAIGNPVQATGLQNVLWDNSNHVYALTEGSLYIFNFDGQALTPAPGSPHPVPNATSFAVVPGS